MILITTTLTHLEILDMLPVSCLLLLLPLATLPRVILSHSLSCGGEIEKGSVDNARAHDTFAWEFALNSKAVLQIPMETTVVCT